MNDEVKTLGYLLKHYTDSQCYDQYVPLSWLKSKIGEKQKTYEHAPEWNTAHGWYKALCWVLKLLEG